MPINFPTNIRLNNELPLDDRCVVNTAAERLALEFVYEGLTVFEKDSKKLYIAYLLDDNTMGWKLVGEGGSSDIYLQGYYYNQKFYQDDAHTQELSKDSNRIYLDIANLNFYKYLTNVGYIPYTPRASELIYGTAKLYNALGSNEDGAVAQKIITEKLTEVDDKIEDVSEDVSSLSESVAGVTETVTELGQSVTTLSDEVSGLGDEVDTLSGQVTQVEGQVSGLGVRVDSAESTVAALGSNVSALDTNVSNLQGRVASAESSISSVQTRVASAEQNISNLSTNKQDKLVSGTNIKKINNQSLLGSGNITIDDAKTIVYKESKTAQITVGGITAGTDLTNKTIEEIITLLVTDNTPPTTLAEIYAVGLKRGDSPVSVDQADSAEYIVTSSGSRREAFASSSYTDPVYIVIPDQTYNFGMIMTQKELRDITFMNISNIDEWTKTVKSISCGGTTRQFYVYITNDELGVSSSSGHSYGIIKK